MASLVTVEANQNGVTPKGTKRKTSRVNSSTKQLKRQFKQNFDALAPLILQEWTQLKRAELTATKGDLEAVIDYIAEETERTRTLIRRQLTELYTIWAEETVSEEAEQEYPMLAAQEQLVTSEEDDSYKLKDYVLPAIEKTIKLLEQRAEALLDQTETELFSQVSKRAKSIEERAEEVLNSVEKKVLPEVKSERDKEKLNKSLLTVFGVGFILGLIFGGFRGR